MEVKNALVMPFSLYAVINHTKSFNLMRDKYMPDTKLCLVDGDGNVHYFEYLGKNLALGDHDAG